MKHAAFVFFALLFMVGCQRFEGSVQIKQLGRVVAEGQWRNGLFVAEEDRPLVNSPAKVGYPSQQQHQHQGFVRRPSHHNVHAARSPLETHYEESSLSNNNGGRSGSNAQGQSHPQEQTPMIHNQQQQQQHRKVVCGMFWTTSAGNGAYTGEVNERNIPDGVGSMRYNSGMVAEGLWHDGEMTEDANEEDEDGVDDCRSYSDGNMLDDFMRRNSGPTTRRNGSSASVM